MDSARPCAAAFRRGGLCGAAPALGGAAWPGRGETKGGIPLDAGASNGAAKDGKPKKMGYYNTRAHTHRYIYIYIIIIIYYP